MMASYVTFPKFLLFIFGLILLVLPATEAWAQDEPANCRTNIEEAERQMADGLFDNVIRLIEPCSESAMLTREERARTFKVLADAYLAKRYLEEARGAIAKLLDLSPEFSPDVTQDTQLFRNLVDELREERVPPAPPSNFSLSATASSISLSWTIAPDESLSQIRILRGASAASLAPIDSVNATVTSYVDTSAQPGITYYYSLETLNKLGMVSSRVQVQSSERPAQAEAQPEQTPPALAASSKKKSGGRKWLFIGGGAAAAVVGGILILSGNTTDPPPTSTTTLPGPPGIP